MKRLNPLFEVMAKEETTSSLLPPISPFSGKPMVKATCAGIPCYVDLDNRLVLPSNDQ